MWWKQHKWRVLGPVLALILLTAAFFADGGIPADRTQDVDSAPQAAEQTTPPAEQPEAPEEPTVPKSTVQADASETTGQSAQPEEAPPQTEPASDVPVLPEEPAQTAEATKDGAYSCTLSISCAAVLDNLDQCAAEKQSLIPANGWVLEPLTVSFSQGESVFDVLQRVCRQQNIHLEFENTPLYDSAYIEGISNLYEFDAGPLSGWMYQVNDWFPNYGCSRYQLQDGDTVRWVYTCDLGADIGAEDAAGQQ